MCSRASETAAAAAAAAVCLLKHGWRPEEHHHRQIVVIVIHISIRIFSWGLRTRLDPIPGPPRLVAGMLVATMPLGTEGGGGRGARRHAVSRAAAEMR
eukprot:scaffold3610_cov202-Prasinococcus_capsulatus_cf.AAC.1